MKGRKRGSRRRNTLFAILLTATLVCASLSPAVGATIDPESADVESTELPGAGTIQDPYQIANATELQAIQDDLGAHYVLVDDIDASETADWNGGNGFEPIGSLDDPFTGTFDGQNHTITGVTVDRQGEVNQGLFGQSEGTIEHVRLEQVTVTGGANTGGLVGTNHGEVAHVSVSGTVEGLDKVGGVVGFHEQGTVQNAVATADVTGERSVGGLVGRNNEQAEGVAFGVATGSVTGDTRVGGLVGLNQNEIRQSYARGDVEAREGSAGGIAGGSDSRSTLQFVYAAGSVTGPDEHTGGLVGGGTTEFVDAYWDVETTDQEQSTGEDLSSQPDGVDDLTTAQMTGPAASTNMDAMSFDHVWAETDGYPVLQRNVEDVTLSLAADKVAVGNETNASVAVALEGDRTAAAAGSADYATNASNAAVNAGTVATDDTGGVEITATVAGESDTETLAVLTPPDVSFVDASLPAEGVPEGSPAVAEATLRNDGGMPGTHAVNISVDGEHATTETVRVEGHSEQSIPVTWTPDAAGSYDLTVEGADVGSVTTVDADAVSVGDAEGPEYVAPNESFEVSVDLENSADVPVALPATYAVGGETVAERAVVADTGTSTVTFEHAVSGEPGDAVEQEFTIGSQTLSATSEIGQPADFSVTGVSAADATVGGSITVTATVENVGDLAGSDTVDLQFAGETVATEEVSLDGGETTEVTAEVTPEAAGSADITAQAGDDEQSTSVAVEAAATETPGGDGASDGGDGGDGASDGESSETETTAEDGPGFTAVLALVALLGAALAVRRR